MAIHPRRQPKATAVLSAKGRGRPVGRRVGLLPLAGGRSRRCARRALPPRPEDMRVRRKNVVDPALTANGV